ncbi:chaperonin 10-like protein [Helicostylum pulchrum]|uniref:Enoyl reductase (ER) domain-containing protein n=1 Tax=Helicostylum pulchrum TaxID=562976 RepID=A0ABP9YAM4_9FUNG|nr:chaperonin 10-like protein [Helicostylum pulchrum]
MTVVTEEKFIGYGGLQPYVLKDETTHLQPMEFVPRPLEDDEVEIEVSACGICGSDIHQLTNGWNRATFPIIPGHEFIGKITAVGCLVKTHSMGQRVGVSPVSRSCGDCELCHNLRGQYCASKVTTYNGNFKGHKTFGGYANKVRVQATWAIPIPDSIRDIDAPLLCAGITTYLPFKHQNIGKDTSVAVLGIGGLGHLAIQWAKAKQCKKVIAISTSDRKKGDAIKLGATDFLVLNQDGTYDPKYAKSVDVLLVCGSGKNTNWTKLVELVKIAGKLILIDLPEQPLVIESAAVVYGNVTIVGTYVGCPDDLKEMLQFADETGVRPWVTTVDNSLEGVNQGVKDLINGKSHYRIVIDGIGRQKE